jgi:hypothetical protein
VRASGFFRRLKYLIPYPLTRMSNAAADSRDQLDDSDAATANFSVHYGSTASRAKKQEIRSGQERQSDRDPQNVVTWMT